MKNTFYFQHDNTASSDEKIIDLLAVKGYEGYGIYWALIELLHKNDGKMQLNSKRLAYAIQIDEQTLLSIIKDFNLFIIEGDYFHSKRLLNQITYRKNIVELRRKAGSIGGKTKAGAKHMLSKNKPKERKGKGKENIIYTAEFEKFWTAYPNAKAKKNSFEAWQKAKNKPSIEMILKKIESQKNSDQWKNNNGKFIPMSTTYINQERWDDKDSVVSKNPEFTM